MGNNYWVQWLWEFIGGPDSHLPEAQAYLIGLFSGAGGLDLVSYDKLLFEVSSSWKNLGTRIRRETCFDFSSALSSVSNGTKRGKVLLTTFFKVCKVIQYGAYMKERILFS